MKPQRGVALITAVLVVALATIASAMLLVSANAAIHRTMLLMDTERASWVAAGLESWVLSILARDEERGVDHLGEEWAAPVDYLPVDHGHVQGGILDLQGRFNLNNLAVAAPERHIAEFRRLLEHLEVLEAGTDDPVPAILDWMDADNDQRFPFGAEDTVYLNLRPPYRTANRRLESVSELLAIQGISKKVYRALVAAPKCAVAERPQPCITALPQPTPVNLNTAPEPVMRALSQRVDEAKLMAFLERRVNDEPARERTTAAQDAGLLDAELGSVAVASAYYQLRGTVFIGSGRVSLYSSIHRPEQGAPVVLDHSSEP